MTVIRLTTIRMICMLCVAAWSLAATAAPSAAAAVGEITMLLGSVKLVGKDGAAREASLNGPVNIGDSIETAAGGHVHVRFVDGGMISVRPASRLLIEDYRPQEAAGSQTAPQKAGAIKFRLDDGVVRSITGRWGEAAREHFRLNTPIAAIGIKGTDFVVQAAPDSVRIAVHSGAIIAAPFGDHCSKDALGPCQGEGTQQLSAEMGRVMIEFQRQLPPRILPRNGILADVAPAARSTEEGATPGHRSVSGDPVNETSVQKALSAPAPAAPATPSPLVWGRWDYVQLPGDRLTSRREEAASFGRERIAENEYYVLYRLPQPLGLPDAGTGTVSFGMASAQANLIGSNGVPQLAKVESGNLQLDFSSRQFNTSLMLNSAPTRTVEMKSSGPILLDGTFYSAGIYTRVKGAFTGDLREAAYLFEKSTPQGMFTGIVNWR